MNPWDGFSSLNLTGAEGRQMIQFDPNMFKEKGWDGWKGSAVHLGPDAQQNHNAELYFEDEGGNRLGGGNIGRANSWDLSGIDPSKQIFARWSGAGPGGLNLKGVGRTGAQQVNPMTGTTMAAPTAATTLRGGGGDPMRNSGLHPMQDTPPTGAPVGPQGGDPNRGRMQQLFDLFTKMQGGGGDQGEGQAYYNQGGGYGGGDPNRPPPPPGTAYSPGPFGRGGNGVPTFSGPTGGNGYQGPTVTSPDPNFGPPQGAPNGVTHVNGVPVGADGRTPIGGFARGAGAINLGGGQQGQGATGSGMPHGGFQRPNGAPPLIPGNTGGWGPGNPGAGGQTANPGQPQTWQDLIAGLFGGNQGSNENRQLGRTGIDPRLDALYETFLGQAVNRYNDPNGQQFYSGQTVAGLSPDEIAAQGMLRNLAGGMGAFSGAGMDYATSALQRGTNPGNNPALDAAIAAMAKDTNQAASDPGGVFSQIRQQSLHNGAYGGTRQGVAEGVAAGRISSGIASESARMRLAGQQQDIDAAQGALSQTGNALQGAMAPSTMLSAIGGQNRALSQAQMDDQLRRWSYNTFEPDRRLQNIFQLMGSSPLGGYQTGQSWTGEDFINNPGSGGTSNAQNIAGILGLLGAGWNLFK